MNIWPGSGSSPRPATGNAAYLGGLLAPEHVEDIHVDCAIRQDRCDACSDR